MPEAFTAFSFGSFPGFAKRLKRIHKSFNEGSKIKKTFGCKPIFLSPEIWTGRLRFACLYSRTRSVAGSYGGFRCNFLGLDNP